MSALLLLTFSAFATAAEPSWPPELRGVKNSFVTLTTPAFLEIPAAVQEAATRDGAAPFDMAKTPPTVELAFPGHLGPNAAERRLWSQWGDICVAHDGRVYFGIGDHGNDVGGDARCFIYRWDPKAKTLEQVVDMNQVVPPRDGQPAWSKVHAKIDEGADGKIYFSATLNAGDRAKFPTYGFNDNLPGGQLYQYDPATGKTTVFASLPPRRCTATSLFDRSHHTWWCNLEAGEGNALFGINLSTKQVVYQGTDGSVGFNRNFALARDGSIIFNGDDSSIMRLNATTKEILKTHSTFAISKIEVPPKAAPKGKPKNTEPTVSVSPGMRASTGESKDGFIYGTTQVTNQLFRYSVRKDELTLLGPTWLAGSYTTVMILSPDEKYLYYLPGSHGGAFKDGTPVVQYNLTTGRRKVLAFLAPAIEAAHEYVPAGTYGVKLSDDGSTLYVDFNGHPVEKYLPKHLKPIGFGLCAFAAIHIPASERQ